MTRGEQRALRDRNALLEASLRATQEQLDEVRMALLDAKKQNTLRGEVNPEMLHSVRALAKFDVGQFEAVNR